MASAPRHHVQLPPLLAPHAAHRQPAPGAPGCWWPRLVARRPGHLPPPARPVPLGDPVAAPRRPRPDAWRSTRTTGAPGWSSPTCCSRPRRPAEAVATLRFNVEAGDDDVHTAFLWGTAHGRSGQAEAAERALAVARAAEPAVPRRRDRPRARAAAARPRRRGRGPGGAGAAPRAPARHGGGALAPGAGPRAARRRGRRGAAARGGLGRVPGAAALPAPGPARLRLAAQAGAAGRLGRSAWPRPPRPRSSGAADASGAAPGRPATLPRCSSRSPSPPPSAAPSPTGCPTALAGEVSLGQRVAVPFGRSPRATGYVVGFPTAPPPGFELRDVVQVLDAFPPFTPKLVELLRWAEAYYLVPARRAPPRRPAARASTPAAAPTPRTAAASSTPPRPPAPPRRSPRCSGPGPSGRCSSTSWPAAASRWTSSRRPCPTARAALGALVKRGLALLDAEVPVVRSGLLEASGAVANPTADQARALAGDRRRPPATFTTFLLHGVTGSGKTEVYLQAIARARAAGRGALVLVPEIALTPQLAGRFRARFGDEVALLHSGLSDAERHAEWLRLRRGQARICVGVRSAIFAPVEDLAVIVVDEEHEGSFKQEDGPPYHARDLAVVRGRLEDAVVVLGSATPSLETLENARRGRYRLLELPIAGRRPAAAGGGGGRPLRRAPRRPGAARAGLLSPPLAEALGRHPPGRAAVDPLPQPARLPVAGPLRVLRGGGALPGLRGGPDPPRPPRPPALPLLRPERADERPLPGLRRPPLRRRASAPSRSRRRCGRSSPPPGWPGSTATPSARPTTPPRCWPASPGASSTCWSGRRW